MEKSAQKNPLSRREFIKQGSTMAASAAGLAATATNVCYSLEIRMSSTSSWPQIETGGSPMLSLPFCNPCLKASGMLL